MGRITLALSVAVWLCAAGWGLARLALYSHTPGTSGADVAVWPSESRIARVRGSWNLVLFLHPHCPCSRASIGELNRLLARAGGSLAAHIVFLDLPDIYGSDLWESAAAIPGATRVALDPVALRRFGAVTSGHALLYDPRGRLRFRGGITSARGHYGDSAGRAAIIRLIGGHADGFESAPVFGCSIAGDGR